MASSTMARCSAASKAGTRAAKPAQAGRRVMMVPRAQAINSPSPSFRESGSDAPRAAGAVALSATPFDNYQFAPIREAKVCSCPLGNASSQLIHNTHHTTFCSAHTHTSLHP
jgi:hypothetical protein